MQTDTLEKTMPCKATFMLDRNIGNGQLKGFDWHEGFEITKQYENRILQINETNEPYEFERLDIADQLKGYYDDTQAISENYLITESGKLYKYIKSFREKPLFKSKGFSISQHFT